jgi:hypothetical protein
MSTTKVPTHMGLPDEALKEAATKFTRVAVRILRRNPKGQLASLFTGEKALDDLWTLDGWLSGWTGGGEYRIEVRDPAEPSGDYVIPPFTLLIEGRQRPANYAGSAHEPPTTAFTPFAPDPYHGAVALPPQGGPMPMAPGGLPPEHPHSNHAPPLQPWALGLPPEERIDFERHRMYRYPQQRLPPGATMASDELALKELAQTQAQNAKLQAQLEATLAKLDEAKADAREAMHRADIAALTAKIEAMSAAPKEAPKPAGPFGLDPQTAVALVTGLAPVFIALVQGRASSAESATKMQFEATTSLMNATLSQANRESSLEKLLPVLAPLALPLIQNMLSHKDPEKQAALYEAMANNNLNSISMMAQLVEGMAQMTSGGEEKWWVGVLRETLGGVVQMTEKYMTTGGGLPGQQPSPQLPQPTGHMTAAPMYRRDTPPAPTATAQTREVPKEVQALFAFLPTEYRTPEWTYVLQTLHYEPPVPAMAAAEALAAQIETLAENHALPEAFQGFFEHPREVLESILERLPVSVRRPAWATEVLELTLRHLVTDNYLSAEATGVEPFEAEPEIAGESEPIDVEGEDVTHTPRASAPVRSFGVTPELVRA